MKMVNPCKILKIELSDYGSYLGRSEGCFEVRNKNGKLDRYPHFENEIGEVILKSGSYVSVDALIDLALWNIDTYIMTRHNRTVAFLRNLEDNNNVETRINQYKAYDNGKGIEIAKQLVLAKIEGQKQVLEKYSLEPFDIHRIKGCIESITSNELKVYRRRLIHVEAEASKEYFKKIFELFQESLRPEGRKTRKAYDGINNVFNFGYYILKCRVHKALLNAQQFATTNTSADGSFAVDWLPPASGNYLINATYWGNSIYSLVFTAVNVLVTPPTENQTQNVFSVDSNSTVTGLAFNSETGQLSFSVSGESGTTGYAEIYIAKSLVSDASNIQASIDGGTANFTVSSTGDSWVLYFSYHHSSHTVVFSLNSDMSPAPTEISELTLPIVALVLAAIATITGVVVLKRRTRTSFRVTKNGAGCGN